MIVIGLDVHKHALTAVAVDELGRSLGERTTPVAAEPLRASARSLDPERLWALEDCRHVTRGLEQALLAAGEQLVRVPPRLTAPQRRRGRSRGKSDALDALAIARAALQERRLDYPRAGEERLRELKLLLDHRDDLVAERRRAQRRLRWHLHELDPTLNVPLGALDRSCWLERLGRRLARREQTTQVRIARDLLARCRSLTRSVLELERELSEHSRTLAPGLLGLPGCGPLGAAKLLCEIGPIERFGSDAQLARHAGVAPLEASSGKHRRHRLDRGGNRQLNCALHRIAVTQGRVYPPARAYLERKQSRGQEPSRGAPLPQAPAGPDRLHDAQERAVIDIGATLGRTGMSKSSARQELLYLEHGMAGSDKIYVTCERCARSIRVVVVDSEHEQLTAAEQAAVQVYEEWFERFDPEQDAYVHRCPDCVKHSDVRLWIGIGDPEFSDHTAPDYRRRDAT